MATQRMLHTKDGVPLSDILAKGQREIELFNEAPRVVRELLGQNINEQQFRVYTGDMEWEELAEGEHPRTGDLQSFEMAFSVKTFGRSLGMTQDLIEDHSADYVLRRFDALVQGALQKEHSVVFNTIQNAWADGSQLWFDPEDHGAYSFSNTHNHTFADSDALFGDANSHKPSEYIREANKEIRHHGKTPSIALMSSESAAQFVGELGWNASYVIPQFETLRSTALPETVIQIDGTRLMQTAWLNDDEVHVIAADEKPLYFHERRPVQITNGEYGGPVGDPATLLGAYGSARYGAVVPDPLAGVKFNMDDVTLA